MESEPVTLVEFWLAWRGIDSAVDKVSWVMVYLT